VPFRLKGRSQKQTVPGYQGQAANRRQSDGGRSSFFTVDPAGLPFPVLLQLAGGFAFDKNNHEPSLHLAFFAYIINIRKNRNKSCPSVPSPP